MIAPASPTLDSMAQREADEALLQQLKTARQSYEPTLRDIGDFIAPYYHEFPQEANQSNRGQQRDLQIINERPSLALQVGISGTYTSVCPPTEQWFEIETDDPELNKQFDVKSWLETVTPIVAGELLKSNFYTVCPEYFANILAFGTAAQVLLEDYSDDAILWFANMPCGSYWLANDNRNRPAIFARELSMTAHQICDEFGEENVSKKILEAKASKQSSQNEFPVVHVVRPNKQYVPGNLLSKDKPFISRYYEAGNKDKAYLRVEGFDRNPIQAARWMTRGNNAYGFGPGHHAVRSAMGLMAREADLALAGEKQINPPLNAPPGTDIGALSLLPGYINQVPDPGAGQGLRPVYEVGFNLSHGQDMIQRIEARIAETFYNNIFLMIANDTGGKMTAREVVERAHEKRLALTPIVRLTNEYLTPTIARAMEICGKRGKLPPYPEALRGKQLRIQFKSVLVEAANLEDAMAIDAHMQGAVLPMLEIFPDIADNYDSDELDRVRALKAGIPNSIRRNPKDRDEMRQARAEQAQQQAEAAQAEQAAQTAKTLSETDTGNKSALTDLVNGAQ